VTGYLLVTCVLAALTGLIAQYNNTPTKGWAAAATTMTNVYVVWYGFSHSQFGHTTNTPFVATT